MPRRTVNTSVRLHSMTRMSTDDVDINHFPVEKGEIHLAIAKRFAASRFSKMTQDDIETPDVSFGKSASTHAGGGRLIL